MTTAILAAMLSPAAQARTRCEARVAAAYQNSVADDPAPVPLVISPMLDAASRKALEDRNARLQAEYAANPHSLRDATIQTMQEHHCHGQHAYIDEPADKTITITGTVYRDGTTILEAR